MRKRFHSHRITSSGNAHIASHALRLWAFRAQPNNTGSGDICDPHEVHPGTADAACPADSFEPRTTVCGRGSGEVCDPDQSCPATPRAACPAETFASSTTACPDDQNVCTADHCDGVGGCAHEANTLPRDDADPCTVEARCGGAICMGRDVIVRVACDWAIVSGTARHPTRPSGVSERIREDTTVVGDICGDTVTIGDNSLVFGAAVGS